tara:strand:- start:379 stop:2466 length:2088 start_codon:yes stop_codon:yes gene_type:complete
MEQNATCIEGEYSAKEVSKDPKVYTIDNFLSDEVCAHFINLAKEKGVNDALVSDNKKGYVSKGRTGKNCWISHYTDKITTEVGERISKLVGLPLCNAEAFQLIYYDLTQEYKQHYDSWDHNGSEKSRRCMKFGGQRMKTALCYLNNVEEGGGTKFVRLNKIVNAEAGKLLVFHNTYPNSNKKHLLSEHAGMPVIKGEKWAFNLWFREESRSKIVYNPPLGNSNNEQVSSAKVAITNGESLFDNKYIQKFDNVINSETINNLKSILTFNSVDNKSTCWVQNSKVPQFIKTISELTKTDSDYYDNMCFVQYPRRWVHGKHFDAFDSKSPTSYIHSEKQGQRMKTITGFLTSNLNYNFCNINKTHTFDSGTLMLYNNVKDHSIERNQDIIKIITNTTDEVGIMFYLFVRERSKNCDFVPKLRANLPPAPPTAPKKCNRTTSAQAAPVKPDNYMKTLEEVYKTFVNNSPARGGKNSLIFSGMSTRRGWPEVVETIKKMYSLRDGDNGLLNMENLKVDYNFNEYNPAIIEKTVNDEAIKLIGDYYYDGIKSGFFELGDRQSNRYKSRNDPVSRMLQYELLPLVEHFTGKKLRPTYTYLSCYIKGCDLPAHTDQADCEYTCSYILKKPEGAKWPIYAHKIKQPRKFKGRYPFTPPTSEAWACDCEAGGLMCFNGTDHIHWREKLEHEYFYVALLHYRQLDS